MKRVDVAVCVASYRRRAGLQALLGGLESLRFSGEAVSLSVHVADNDALGSAREVCEDARAWFSHPIEYSLEPRKGIPHARNATLRSALGAATWLAFIDDDEVPEPDWLDQLLATQRETGADVVTGPVVARFEEKPPDWVIEGGFFDSPRWPTGAVMNTAHTNNALVRADAVASIGAWFDERLTLGVGEDTGFFESLRDQGCRIVWCDEAVVYDGVPRDRATAAWLVRRGFRVGASRTHIERCHHPDVAVSRALLRGAWRLMGGLGRALVAREKASRVRGLHAAALGVGRVAGLLGVR